MTTLWTCWLCGKQFARTNQAHSCNRVELADLFAGKPEARAIFDALRALIASLGPSRMETSRSGVTWLEPRSFAEAKPMVGKLRIAFLLSRTLESPRIKATLAMSGGSIVHTMDVERIDALDDELHAWLREAHARAVAKA